MTALATLNGQRVTACRVSLPSYGLWWAEVECASAEVMTGSATLVLDDLTLRGTILTGGTYQTRTRYRIVAGAGGWGRTVAKMAYTNDAGVKVALVLRDAATACGETLGTVSPSLVVGPAFTRAAEPASRVLDAVAPRAWYVDELGVTQLGRRPVRVYTGTASRMVNDAAQVRYEIAPEVGTLSSLLPGVTVDGVEAVDVEHELAADGKLRTTLWGRGIADTTRLTDAIRRIVESHTARARYCAPWEYRVVHRTGERLDLQATRVSSGMPDLRAVRIRPGVAGVRAHPALGSLVTVSFLNGDPSRPVVTGFDDQDGAGFIAAEIALQAGATGTTAGVTEHATSAEAMVAFVHETLKQLATPLGGSPAVTAAVLAAIPLAAASSISPFSAALASALASKTANTTGNTPGLGWPAVRGG